MPAFLLICSPDHWTMFETRPTVKVNARFTTKRFVVAAILISTIGVAFAYRDALTVAGIREFVHGLGAWGPLVFILIYCIAPALFLPGLPLDLAAGLVFGPFWGTLYTSVGATGGATVAFLVARTVGRDGIRRMMSGRLAKIAAGVESEGWRFVAFTRLVPIIPFNVLNYALGLTRIGLAPYVAASFIFMLPTTAAYVYAGWAGGEAAAGEGTLSGTVANVIVALTAIGLVAVVPRFLRRAARRRAARLGRQERSPR